MGPTFLGHIRESSQSFVEYLKRENIAGLSVNKVIVPEDFLYSGKVGIDINIANSSYDGLFDYREREVFNNAVHDSVSRSLFTDMDALKVRIDDSYNSFVISSRQSYSSTLFDYYLSLLTEIKPDCVCISHGNYDIYVNLYIAAKRLGIPTLVVHGGHGHSYIIHNKKLVDPCPSNLFDELFDYFDEDKDAIDTFPCDLSSLIKSQSLSFSKTGASCWTISENNRRLDITNNPILLAMAPILAEHQNRNCLEFMNYQSKSDWIKHIIEFSAKSEIDLMFYIHPDLKEGFELSLVTAVISHFSNLYSIKPNLITTKEELADTLKNRFAFACSPSGTIASELASLGGKSIISNYCSACKIPGTTAVLDKYTRMQDIYASYTNENGFNKENFECKRLALQNTSKFFKAIGKYNPSKLKIQTALDRIFFFGETRTKLNLNTAISSFVESFSLLTHDYIDTPNFRCNYYR